MGISLSSSLFIFGRYLFSTSFGLMYSNIECVVRFNSGSYVFIKSDSFINNLCGSFFVHIARVFFQSIMCFFSFKYLLQLMRDNLMDLLKGHFIRLNVLKLIIAGGDIEESKTIKTILSSLDKN